MRNIAFLALVTTLGCNGADPETDTDDVETDTDTDTDTDADTDTDTDTDSDTDTDTDSDTDYGITADFVDNGPGLGDFWDLSVPTASTLSPNDCGVEKSAYSFNFVADTVTVDVLSVNAGAQTFDAQLTSASWTPAVGCYYEDDGSFACDSAHMSQNLNSLPPPYTMDAVISDTFELEGQFMRRDATDPEGAPHTYEARWAADWRIKYSRDCTGSACSTVVAATSATQFPCTTPILLETFNYDDPALD